MSIRDWPAAERPREKLLERGAGSLSDAELLAVFLRTGVAGMSAVDLARFLLEKFGGLRQLLEADMPTFLAEMGLGPAKYTQLQAVMEIGRRHLAETIARDSAIQSPDAVRRYLKSMLRHEKSEAFGCLFLDTTVLWGLRCCLEEQLIVPTFIREKLSGGLWRKMQLR
jgi:DNA repair protein RadC